VRLLSETTATGNPQVNRLIIYAAAAAIIAAGIIRYAAQASFWLDEAFVAASLREPSLDTIFARLRYGQLFPRTYLAAIAAIRELLGYETWTLRLLPFLSFLIATVLWARLLASRARDSLQASLIAAALLLGSIFWVDQAAQLKQYTLEVCLALIPFVVADTSLKESLAGGKRKWLLMLLAAPCILSYTYTMALCARLAGWYLDQGRREGWRVNAGAVVTLGLAVAVALAGLWATDYRFNIQDRDAYLSYWKDCILRSAFEQDFGSGLRLIAKYLWGWNGFATAVIAPLQVAGAYSVVRRVRRREATEPESWGSRSVGSIILIAGVMLASIIIYYPICAGRLTLFVQVHLQILALEGALFLAALTSFRKAARIVLSLCALVVLAHSARGYLRFLTSEPAENLRAMLPMIRREITDSAWVHPCSAAQVRALPEGLPVGQVTVGASGRFPAEGEKVWIIWTHLGNEGCVKEFEALRARARSWQVISQGAERGLALAEF
jgi:hypothetical protein